jgi:hypothetical protein
MLKHTKATEANSECGYDYYNCMTFVLKYSECYLYELGIYHVLIMQELAQNFISVIVMVLKEISLQIEIENGIRIYHTYSSVGL